MQIVIPFAQVIAINPNLMETEHAANIMKNLTQKVIFYLRGVSFFFHTEAIDFSNVAHQKNCSSSSDGH